MNVLNFVRFLLYQNSSKFFRSRYYFAFVIIVAMIAERFAL